jgi:DNA-directed RNA polymerase specialized sigma24 family protein
MKAALLGTQQTQTLLDQSIWMLGHTDRRLSEIEAIYRSRFPYFVQVARAIVGDTERAVEAVQDGFASAIQGRAAFRGDGPLEAWLWRAVLNAARRPPKE